MAVREQTELNENPMRAVAAPELSRAVTALITAWLEVRVLPGPPRQKNDIERIEFFPQSVPLKSAVGHLMFFI